MENTTSIEEIKLRVQQGNLKEAGRLIQLAVHQRIDFQGMHVSCANMLVASMPWAEVSALLPAGINSLFTSGWVNSVLVGRPVDSSGNAIPWFTYPAIEFLESVVKKDWKVFEWGSGNSTIWWSKNCSMVRSAENNPSWCAEVRSKLSKNAEVMLCEEKEAYVNAINNFPGLFFDVVVIDGEHRNDCAYACIESLSGDGIIVFDNSDRSEYDESINFLQSNGFKRIDFWGLIPSYVYRNCTSIFFRNIENIFPSTLPSKHLSSLGLSCEQSIEKINAKSNPPKGSI
jgi:hypothetical protein